MAKKNVLTSESFRLTARYRAACKERDLKSEWRANQDDAIRDGLAHQSHNPSHRFEILVEQTQKFTIKISQDKIDQLS